jgi:hypothetical protein
VRDCIGYRPGERAYRVEAQIAPQLEPYLIADVLANGSLKSAGFHRCVEALESRTSASVGLTDGEPAAVLVANDAPGAVTLAAGYTTQPIALLDPNKRDWIPPRSMLSSDAVASVPRP